LQGYTGSTPFLLSGGISATDAGLVKQINHPQFRGVDLNSKFEVSPGLKDVELLKQFTKEIKSSSSSSEKPEMSNDI
jgi:phosphoribosylanthranilate isomerase